MRRLVFIFFAAFISCFSGCHVLNLSDRSENVSSSVDEMSQAEQDSATTTETQLSADEYKSQCIEITDPKDVSRYPSKYSGKYVKMIGYAAEIFDIEYIVTDNSGLSASTIQGTDTADGFRFEYADPEIEPKAVKGDKIRVYGQMADFAADSSVKKKITVQYIELLK